MKKILSFLVLGSLLCVLLAPVMVLAVEGSQECCELKATVEIDGVKYQKGIAVGNVIEADQCGETSAITANCRTSAGVQSDSCITPKWGTICLFNTIYGVTNLLFGILMALAILFFVYGGVTMVMASGDAEKYTKGKDYIMYALIGIFVALISKALPSIIKTAMGM